MVLKYQPNRWVLFAACWWAFSILRTKLPMTCRCLISTENEMYLSPKIFAISLAILVLGEVILFFIRICIPWNLLLEIHFSLTSTIYKSNIKFLLDTYKGKSDLVISAELINIDFKCVFIFTY